MFVLGMSLFFIPLFVLFFIEAIEWSADTWRIRHRAIPEDLEVTQRTVRAFDVDGDEIFPSGGGQ